MNVNALEIAKTLAKQNFPGWTWGQRFSVAKRTMPCCGFVERVLSAQYQAYRGKTTRFSKDIIRRINVSETIPQGLSSAILSNDARIKGAVSALELLGVGHEVTSPKRGDYIQYWTTAGESWAGHTGIVDKVQRIRGQVKVYLFGSHKSIDGIGRSIHPLTIEQHDNKRVYIGRFGNG